MSNPPFKVKAVFDYTSPHEDDLHFPNGQIITVTDEEDADWYSGEYLDASGVKQEGIFPRNFVEKYEPTAPPRPTRTARPKKETEAPAPVAAPVPEPLPIESDEPKEQYTEPAQSPEPEVIEAAPIKPEPVIATASRPVEVAVAAPPPASKPAPVVSKPSSPPPVTEKPTGGSFKDRIAAFNKSSAAPPPAPFKPGGLGGSSFIKKPFVAPPPSKDAYVPPPREAPPQKIYKREEDPEIAAKESENLENAERAGLSPSSNNGEEEDQPKPTSLKERIALLQKQQAEQASRHADAAQKKEKPKRPPTKKRTESHNLAEAEDGAALEKLDSHDTAARKSIESTREEPVPIRSLPRRKSDRPPPVIPAIPSRDIFQDGNDADMSGAGDETEGAEEVSTGRDDSDNKSRARTSAPAPPARVLTAPMHEPDVGEEDGAVSDEEADPRELVEDKAEEEEEEEEDGDEEEEEEEIDPEVRRKEEIRARMAKMSGGMGMHGMFGPPGGMPMPGPPTRKSKPSGPSEKKSVGDAESTEDATTARAPPVPMMALPGMSRVRSPEESTQPPHVEREVESYQAPITGSHRAEEVPDVEDIKIGSAPSPPIRSERPPPPPSATFSHDSLSAPPVPGGRPAPPPVPTESRPLAPPPSAPMSPSAGSESDDEKSLSATPALSVKTTGPGLPTRELPPRPPGAPAVPSHGYEGPSSPRSPTNKRTSFFGGEMSPESPNTSGTANRRGSRVPPIPGSIPAATTAQTRAPPPPPPTQALSRSSTGDGGVLLSSQYAAQEDTDEEITEYEGDYDTDIASTVPHKDALKSHTKDSSLDDSLSGRSPVGPPSGGPPPLPPVSAPRAVPPPPPSQPPPNSRQSVDVPRAAPPPPPPPKEQRYDEEEDEEEDDEYDPYKYTTGAQDVSLSQVSTITAGKVEEDLYSASPPRSYPPPPTEKAAPPPPPRDFAPPSASKGPPRQSTDFQRTQSTMRRSTELSRMSMDSGFMANEIDLAEGSLWWNQANSVPPVFQGRKDILYETEESTSTKRGGKTTTTKDLYVLFPDYSQTVITVRFDPSNPSDAAFEQRHEQPPKTLRQDQLEEYHSRFGRKISDAVGTKKETVVADGTPQGLVMEMLKQFSDALLPVGTRAYGALVYTNMANASTAQYDEIRPGDIISLRNARLQGKHGLHKYSMEVGAGIGHVGIVAEWDGTKKKVRAWEQGRESKKVKMESYKLDDLRSGEIKIWRVMPRSWVGWEGDN